MGKFVDLSGLKFGRWRVMSISGRDNQGKLMYNCICDCGTEKTISRASLKSGLSTSCGCYVKEAASKRFTKHGGTKNGGIISEYQAWSDMKQRCYNPKHKSWGNYGGRGIKVCDRWLNSFEDFFSDMGRKPSPKHSLDRYPNNDGNYEPANCRWGTDEQQRLNTRGKVRLVLNGENTYLGKFASFLNVNAETLMYHLKKGKSPDEILAYYNKKRNI